MDQSVFIFFESQPVLSASRCSSSVAKTAHFTQSTQVSGKTVWHYRTRGPIRGPAAVISGTVYFGSGDAYVYAVREGDGRFLMARAHGRGRAIRRQGRRRFACRLAR